MLEAEDRSGTDHARISYFTNLFWKTFEHAQGRENLHREINYRLRLKNPDWHFTADERGQIENSFKELVLSRFGTEGQEGTWKGFHTPVELINMYDSLYSHSSQLFARDYSNISQEPVELFSERINQNTIEITEWVIIADFVQLFIRQGRRREMNSVVPNTKFDPFFSYLRFYAGEGRKTGFSDLDEMYQGVRGHVITAVGGGDWQLSDDLPSLPDISDEELRARSQDPAFMLSVVANIWEQHHDQSFFAPFGLLIP